MNPSTRRARSRHQMFATYALASLVPVLLLGLVLAASYRSIANRRGLAEARSEATFVAWTAVDPLLEPASLANGLAPQSRAALVRTLDSAVQKGELLGAQVFAKNGQRVFASAGAAPGVPAANSTAGYHESGASSSGSITAKLRALDPARPVTTSNPEAIEVDVPLAGSTTHTIGSLEILLPYAPIASDVSSGLDPLYRGLIFGLGTLYVVLVLVSLSVSRRLRHQLRVNRYQSEHDMLTGLANRDLFRRRADAAATRALQRGHESAIAIMDLDRFKDVNDTLGHQNGDQLLVELAERLASLVRQGDTVARLGGDEFGIILSDIEEPGEILAQIRGFIEREFEIDGLPLSVEASIGFVVAPHDGTDVDELLQRVDTAMYTAKATQAGVVAYREEYDTYDPARLSLLVELRRAIEAGQLTLHYQPKMTLSDGSTSSIEALVRWNHPVHGLLYPDRFLPLAEQSDLIDKLTDWVISTALAEMNELGAVGDHLGLAVNVSARNLARDDFAEHVVDMLDLAGIPNHRLTVEITETALFADPARASSVLHALDHAGVKVSLDDFGKGQTSLGYLSSLPFRELKIDQGFITDMLDNEAHAAIVRSIVDLGHNLNLKVVGEGVESDGVLRALRDAGCDTAQGFLLGYPMPLEDLSRWLGATALRELLCA